MHVTLIDNMCFLSQFLVVSIRIDTEGDDTIHLSVSIRIDVSMYRATPMYQEMKKGFYK